MASPESLRPYQNGGGHNSQRQPFASTGSAERESMESSARHDIKLQYSVVNRTMGRTSCQTDCHGVVFCLDPSEPRCLTSACSHAMTTPILRYTNHLSPT